MLRLLSIRNIVLINELEIDFQSGLSVLTGETGAGKSILLDALGFALGERTDSRLLRQGELSAQVTAIFSLSPQHPIVGELEAQEIPTENGEIIFRRLLTSEGKTKCYLNDQLVSQNLMRKIGQSLVQIHGQHERLLDAKTHCDALDAFGKLETDKIEQLFNSYQMAKKELQTFKDNLARSFERRTFLEFAIEEIEKVQPLLGEIESLEQERSFVAHSAKIADVLQSVEKSCDTALLEVSSAHKALHRISDLSPEKIAPLWEASDRSLIELQEVIEGMRHLKREVDGTQHSLESLENRLHTLRTLTRKYQCSDLLECLTGFKQEIERLFNSEDLLEKLEEKVIEERKAYKAFAEDLTEKRKKAALILEKEIHIELIPLKLERARFTVHFEPLDENAWGPKGCDKVEFYIQTNPGSREGPLAEIASGGELSRFMLALKAILVHSASIPILIFDEIESGTGGAVAAAIGDRLKSLSEKMQVLAITHSPQIASTGDHHFVVHKVVEANQTSAHIRNLTSDEKYEEVARMLAGEQITEEARAAARRLVGGTR